MLLHRSSKDNVDGCDSMKELDLRTILHAPKAAWESKVKVLSLLAWSYVATKKFEPFVNVFEIVAFCKVISILIIYIVDYPPNKIHL